MSNAIITPHAGKSRVKKIKDGSSYLHQDVYGTSPSIGEGFISNRRQTRMVFYCPQLMHANMSIFVVFRLLAVPTTGKCGYIVGNDNGGYDKYIGYKTSSSDQLSYGGGSTSREYNCTIPSSVDRTTKHLISCHWMMTNSHIRVNNIVLGDSAFTANIDDTGATYGSIFSNERFNTQPASVYKSISGEIYGLKVVSGFLEAEDISDINNEMMSEYNVK